MRTFWLGSITSTARASRARCGAIILFFGNERSFPLSHWQKAKVSAGATVLRLKTMEDTNDGFKIAEVDMTLRGPGDIFQAPDKVACRSFVILTWCCRWEYHNDGAT